VPSGMHELINMVCFIYNCINGTLFFQAKTACYKCSSILHTSPSDFPQVTVCKPRNAFLLKAKILQG
jgi:hypothetical protein